MVEQADSNDAPMRTPPEFGALRAVDDSPSDDFVAAVEQRAALKGDVAGRPINWRLRRRLKRLGAGLGGIVIVAAIAGGAYLYREGGGDPWADSVTAVGSAADDVGTWIDEQTADTSTDVAGASDSSSSGVVSQADQEVLATNATAPSQDSTAEAAAGSVVSGATETDTSTVSSDNTGTGDADVGDTATAESDIAGVEAIDSQIPEIDVVDPESQPDESLVNETPEASVQTEPEDIVDSSDSADIVAAVDSLAADELLSNEDLDTEVATLGADENETVEVTQESESVEVAPTDTPDAADDIAPLPDAPPSSDDGLPSDEVADIGDTITETATDDVAMPPLPAENIADIDTVLPDETVSDEPVEVAEVAEVVVPVEQLPVMSAFSHTGIRVELADYGSEEQAQDGWRELKSELGGVVGEHIPVIEEGSAGAGLIYRVQIGYFDSAFAAANFCTAVMDRKVTCTVIPQ